MPQARVQLRKLLICLPRYVRDHQKGWGSTCKTPDMLATGPNARPEQAISGVSALKKRRLARGFPGFRFTPPAFFRRVIAASHNPVDGHALLFHALQVPATRLQQRALAAKILCLLVAGQHHFFFLHVQAPIPKREGNLVAWGGENAVGGERLLLRVSGCGHLGDALPPDRLVFYHHHQ